MNDQERGNWTSASNAVADLHCPGRHLTQQQAEIAQVMGVLPIEEESEDAAFGKRVHDALAKNDSAGLNFKEEDLFISCKNIEAELLTKAFGAIEPDKAVGIREKRLWIKFGEVKHSGQSDVIHRKGTRLLIIDYKTLPGEVAGSAKNQQLRDLAVLAWANSPMLQDLWVAIIQPLHTHSPEVCVYTKSEIETARLLMEQRVKASNNIESPRMPGQVQCAHCHGKTICPEYQKWVGAMLPVPKSITEIPCLSWTPEQWALFLEQQSIARKWLDTCLETAKLKVREHPESIPGWGLVPGNIVEKIVDPQGVFDRFSKLGGTLEEFMKCITVQKTKLEPLVREHTQAKGQGLKDAMKTLTAGLTETMQNQPSLKRIA